MRIVSKLMILAGLCLIGVTLVPIASAQAEETFVGACVINGTAEFNKEKLPTKTHKRLPYEFKSTSATCAKLGKKEAEELREKAQTLAPAAFIAAVTLAIEAANEKEAVAGVEGKKFGAGEEEDAEGFLGCESSAGGFRDNNPLGLELLKESGEPGRGHIEIKPTGKIVKFKFRFIGTGTNVHFQAGEEGAADEEASYTAAGEATFAKDTEGTAKCLGPEGEGPTKLKFEAATAGVV